MMIAACRPDIRLIPGADIGPLEIGDDFAIEV
jgi:hypothetical protein